MEFFGLGSASEMETPLGILVKSATDPLLLGPDWAKNLEICDSISSFPEASEAIKAIFHQLKSSDPKVVSLALTLVDTCVQNSWTHVPQAINKTFMEELRSISTGRKGFQNQEEALRLIQVWGRRFEHKQAELPLFYSTYNALRMQGVPFPPDDSGSSSSSSGAAASGGVSQGLSGTATASKTKTGSTDVGKVSTEGQESVGVNEKITKDLNTVLDQIRLCRQMLPESPGISADDLLAEVVGFLEASQERILELLDAGFQGGEGLSEEVLEGCLRVNDALAKTLEAERNGTAIAVEDDNTRPLTLGVAALSASSASSGLTSSLLEEDVDEFATLTLKTAKGKNKKSGANSSGGNKKIPTIKGPGSSTGKAPGLLVPPPPAPSGASPPVSANVSSQSQPPKSQQEVDLDFLGGGQSNSSIATPALAPQKSNNPFDSPPPAPQQHQTSHTNDDLMDIFSPLAPSSSSGGGQMTDAEFDSFLNSPSK